LLDDNFDLILFLLSEIAKYIQKGRKLICCLFCIVYDEDFNIYY
jgi:hypothetical protein